MKTAEVVGWSGKVTIVPRSALKRFRELPEASATVVYFLRGEDDEGERCYVGQSDVAFDRLANHARAKDFWDEAIVLTSVHFGISEVRYLEFVFAKRITNDGLVRVENASTPKPPKE